MLNEDIKVRAYLKKKLKNASVGRIVIERPAKNARITIYSSRPGVVIGKKGEDIEVLKSELQKLMGVPVHVNIEEIRKPEIDAQLIADSIAQQLEKRIMFRRAMKRAMQNAMRLGAQGIKIMSVRPSERYRDCSYRMVSRRSCAPAYAARRYRLRYFAKRKPLTASSASRFGSTRATARPAAKHQSSRHRLTRQKRRGPRRDDGKPAWPSASQMAEGAEGTPARLPAAGASCRQAGGCRQLHRLRKQENNHAATSTQKVS